MKPAIKKNFSFIGSSMLWSLLLYAVVMLVVNWNDVAGTIKGTHAVIVATPELPAPSLLPGSDAVSPQTQISITRGFIHQVTDLVKMAGKVARSVTN